MRHDEILDQSVIDEIIKEFSGDPALQQVHIALKRASAIAKGMGISLIEYRQMKYPADITPDGSDLVFPNRV